MTIRPSSLLLVVGISILILIPRSLLITSAQSERVDDEYHITRGVLFLNQGLTTLKNVSLNDPPVGEAVGILPLWLANTWPSDGEIKSAIWGQRFAPDTILNVIGVWKSLLLLPMIGVAFAWVRSLYGNKAAWQAVALLLVEPTIAAHTPLPSLDVLGMEGIIIGCWLAWRYFQQPTLGRLVAAAVGVGVAILLKHTAIILPGVVLIFAAMWWARRRWLVGSRGSEVGGGGSGVGGRGPWGGGGGWGGGHFC